MFTVGSRRWTKFSNVFKCPRCNNCSNVQFSTQWPEEICSLPTQVILICKYRLWTCNTVFGTWLLACHSLQHFTLTSCEQQQWYCHWAVQQQHFRQSKRVIRAWQLNYTTVCKCCVTCFSERSMSHVSVTKYMKTQQWNTEELPYKVWKFWVKQTSNLSKILSSILRKFRCLSCWWCNWKVNW